MASQSQSRDPASACSAESFQLRHLHLELRVEFGAGGGSGGSLRGCARLHLTCLLDGAQSLVLDTHPTLQVESAALAPAPPQTPCGGGEGEGEGELRPVTFHTRPFASYGSALHLALPEPLACGDKVLLEVAYRAGEGPGVSGDRHGHRLSSFPGQGCPHVLFFQDHVPSLSMCLLFPGRG